MKAEHFSADTQEFLLLLAKHAVDYLIVGGEAVVYYGHARLTGDLDVFYERSAENCSRLYRALEEFWGGTIPEVAGPEDLSAPELVVQFGIPPNRIDLVNHIDGVSFEEAWPNRVPVAMTVGGRKIAVPFIGLAELIRNKRAVSRPRDREDLEFLLRLERKFP